MNEEQNVENRAVTQIRQHQFVVMIGSSITVALFLVFVAMSLYNSSGTIQLDLSRPGYAEARKEAQSNGKVFRGFSPDGAINKQSLSEFNKLYKDRMKEATSLKAFSGDPLSDKTLRFED